jgi:hypothetical protein
MIRCLGQEHFDDGLASRLLLAYPPKRPQGWTEVTVDEKLDRALHLVFERLLLLDFEYGPAGERRPKDLPLTAAAKSLWIDFCNRMGAEWVELTGSAGSLWSKLKGTAARLALILQLVRDPASDAIEKESMAAGIQLADWFGAEGLRIYRILGESDDDRELRELADLIQSKGGSISIRELMRCRKRYEGSADLAEAALDRMVKFGWGHWVVVASRDAGGRPSRRFVLFPATGSRADADETSADPSKSEGCVSVDADTETEEMRKWAA